MTTPNKCIGCQSFKYYCKHSYLISSDVFTYKIFRDRFCPCTTCIVKVTCDDPKVMMSKMGNQTPKIYRKKCRIFADKINEYNMYLKDNNIRTIKIKRKRKR